MEWGTILAQYRVNELLPERYYSTFCFFCKYNGILTVMFGRKRKTNPDDIHISFVVDNTVMPEYIPLKISKFEIYARNKYSYIRESLGLEIYYWHYRHLYPPIIRKQEDLRFFMHVYNDHNGQPTDKIEKRHYRYVWNTYAFEIKRLIIPKLNADKNREPLTHYYTEAYFKRWVFKNANPELSRLYHGIAYDEALEITGQMIKRIGQTRQSMYSRRNYLKKKQVSNQSERNK